MCLLLICVSLSFCRNSSRKFKALFHDYYILFCPYSIWKLLLEIISCVFSIDLWIILNVRLFNDSGEYVSEWILNSYFTEIKSHEDSLSLLTLTEFSEVHLGHQRDVIRGMNDGSLSQVSICLWHYFLALSLFYFYLYKAAYVWISNETCKINILLQ